VRVAVINPAQAYHFLKLVRWRRKAVSLRSKWEQQGVHAPPIIIFSITNRCNLHCNGCYHWALHESSRAEMSAENIRSMFAETKELGKFLMVLAEGEPLVRRQFWALLKNFWKSSFWYSPTVF